MLKLIISILCIALVAPVMADEEIRASAPYALDLEDVTYVGLPGDRGFYEVHRDKRTGQAHCVDSSGREFRTISDMLLARGEAKP